MEVVLSVPEAELEDFLEEATESSGQWEQPSESSHTQGTVKSLLSVEIFPMADLLERIRQGNLYYLDLDGLLLRLKEDHIAITSDRTTASDQGHLSLTSQQKSASDQVA